MALYAIGDLHLSLNSDKPMDIFGEKWQGYVDKININGTTANGCTTMMSPCCAAT